MSIQFRFIYEPSQYKRIIPACIIEARASIPAIKNKIGVIIKAYTDAEVAKVILNEVLVFKIETTQGVLAGYFTLDVRGQGMTGNLYQFVLCPAFKVFTTQISAEISIFITSGEYKQYIL